MEWDNIWNAVGIFVVLVLLFVLCFFALSDKPTLRYYVASDGNNNNLVVRADVQNWQDYSMIANGLTFEHALTIVDSLNAELVRHPRP